MKFSSQDRLCDFEFHDSEFFLVSWEGESLVVCAKRINVHKDAAPNKALTDMEIDEACIIFRGFNLLEFEPARTWERNEDGELYTNDPLIIHREERARELLYAELKGSVRVIGIANDGEQYVLGAIGIDPYFSARFTFTSVLVEWNDYRGVAWYELKNNIRKTLTLNVSGEDTVTEAVISFPHDDVACFGQEQTVAITVNYGKDTVTGVGNKFTWEDALADLEKNLPDGVKIKCCLNCRHGNLCPYGNTPGEIFCTKDVTVTPENVFFYTGDSAEMKKRSRDSMGICADYAEQTVDFFTYNDYIHFA